MREALDRCAWDVIISDYHLPQFDAPSALRVLHESGQDIPFLVVSGVMGEEVAVAMMKAGAHDYLVKGALARLGPAVEREIREAGVRAERRQAEEELRRALELKDALLKEVHHRVKNNLQMVCSLMRLQLNSIGDAALRELFARAEKRILCMADVHNQLCYNDHGGKVELAEHLRSVAQSVLDPDTEAAVSLELHTTPLLVSMDTAIPCGLIVNEMVTNAARHAFPNGRHGAIQLSLREVDNDAVLYIDDNGVGFDTSKPRRPGGSFGLRLVDLLVNQLHGTARFQSGAGDGSHWEVRFPLEVA
jgi:two-component sensor histidine kinase